MSFMKEDFAFSIPNTKAKEYNLFGLLIIAINIILFALFLLYTNSFDLQKSAITGLVVSLFFFIAEKIRGKSLLHQSAIKTTLITLIPVWFFLFKYYIAGFVLLLLTILYLIAQRVMIVKVNKERIYYPSFPTKEFGWVELNNIILKDGLLTIDLKNNKIFQVLISENNPVNEADFNEFCQQQLKTANLAN